MKVWGRKILGMNRPHTGPSVKCKIAFSPEKCHVMVFGIFCFRWHGISRSSVLPHCKSRSKSSQWGKKKKKKKNSSSIKLQTQSNGKGKRKKPAAETSFEVV